MASPGLLRKENTRGGDSDRDCPGAAWPGAGRPGCRGQRPRARSGQRVTGIGSPPAAAPVQSVAGASPAGRRPQAQPGPESLAETESAHRLMAARVSLVTVTE